MSGRCREKVTRKIMGYRGSIAGLRETNREQTRGMLRRSGAGLCCVYVAQISI